MSTDDYLFQLSFSILILIIGGIIGAVIEYRMNIFFTYIKRPIIKVDIGNKEINYDDQSKFLSIVISNVGKSSAKNIEFSIQELNSTPFNKINELKNKTTIIKINDNINKINPEEELEINLYYWHGQRKTIIRAYGEPQNFPIKDEQLPFNLVLRISIDDQKPIINKIVLYKDAKIYRMKIV